MTRTFTHAGWFWFCPILFAEDGEGAMIEPRWPWLGWLLNLCDGFESARIYINSLLDPEYEPTFMFKVRELSTPVVR